MKPLGWALRGLSCSDLYFLAVRARRKETVHPQPPRYWPSVAVLHFFFFLPWLCMPIFFSCMLVACLAHSCGRNLLIAFSIDLSLLVKIMFWHYSCRFWIGGYTPTASLGHLCCLLKCFLCSFACLEFLWILAGEFIVQKRDDTTD